MRSFISGVIGLKHCNLLQRDSAILEDDKCLTAERSTSLLHAGFSVSRVLLLCCVSWISTVVLDCKEKSKKDLQIRIFFFSVRNLSSPTIPVLHILRPEEGHLVPENLSNFSPNYRIDPVKDATKNILAAFMFPGPS